MSERTWPFDVPPTAVVVTTTHVTTDGKAILQVTHECDPEEGIIWQFHSGDGDYSAGVLLLVRLDEVLALDSSLQTIATLPIGMQARRKDRNSPWTVTSLDAS